DLDDRDGADPDRRALRTGELARGPAAAPRARKRQPAVLLRNACAAVGAVPARSGVHEHYPPGEHEPAGLAAGTGCTAGCGPRSDATGPRVTALGDADPAGDGVAHCGQSFGTTCAGAAAPDTAELTPPFATCDAASG